MTLLDDLVALAACVCNELTAIGRPAGCFCGVVHGDEFPVDVGDCSASGVSHGCSGSAWVRLMTAYPTDIFPSPASVLTNCGTSMAYQIEVGIARCARAFSERGWEGEAPTVAERLAEADEAIQDMEALRRAILCCWNPNRDRDIILGSYVPLQSSGGTGGGTWNLFLRRD